MKVSILVPLYNVGEHIEKCARSLFEQSYESVEFVFVDDCSTDCTVELLRSVMADYPHQKSRTRIIQSDSNMGVSHSRNIALEAATGHFVVFIDGDDWVSPEMVEELVWEQMNGDYDVVTSNFYNIEGGVERLVKASLIGGRRGSLRVVVSQSFDLPNRIWGILMRREILMCHDVRFDCRITMGEDFLFLVQLLYYSQGVSHVSKGLYYYRCCSGVMSALASGDSRSIMLRRSYVRAVAKARRFLFSREDYRDYSGALRLSRFNLGRWLMLRGSERRTLRVISVRVWCYALNGMYGLYCRVTS